MRASDRSGAPAGTSYRTVYAVEPRMGNLLNPSGVRRRGGLPERVFDAFMAPDRCLRPGRFPSGKRARISGLSEQDLQRHSNEIDIEQQLHARQQGQCHDHPVKGGLRNPVMHPLAEIGAHGDQGHEEEVEV